MAETVKLSSAMALKLIFEALTGAGAAPENARYFADAILDTELSGLEGHGFYWLQYYCEHLKSGKVLGRVKPLINKISPVAFRIDARNGIAHAAMMRCLTRFSLFHIPRNKAVRAKTKKSKFP